MKTLTVLAGIALSLPAAHAQSLGPDVSFGNNGLVVTAQQTKSSVIQASVIQSDGRIIAAGMSYDNTQHSFLTRYLADGTLDLSFGVQGMVNLVVGWNDFINDVIVQTDGKITVAGNQIEKTEDPVTGGVTMTSKPFLARFLQNGTLDPAFGVNGVHHLDILDIYSNRQVVGIVQLPDGRLIAGGSVFPGGTSSMALVALHTDGSYDLTFGSNGLGTYQAAPGIDATLYDMAMFEGGKLVLAGTSGVASLTAPSNTSMALISVNPNGTYNTGFSSNGMMELPLSTTPNPFDLATNIQVLGSGKILVSGGASGKLALVQLHSDGSMDASFGLNGILVDASRPVADGVGVLASGDIMVSGLKRNNNPYSTDVTLSKYSAAGVIDASFGTAGSMVLDQSKSDRAYKLIVQPDDKIVLAGHSEDVGTQNVSFTLWRLANAAAPNGIKGATIASLQPRLYPNPTNSDVTLSFPQIPEQPLTIRILDVQGRQVSSGTIKDQHTTLSLSGLATGVYTAQLTATSGTQSFKLIKQ